MIKKNRDKIILDLHGLSKIEAEFKLENLFLSLQDSKLEKIKIITGWGQASEPVLFSFVKQWLFDKGYKFSSDAGSFVVKLQQGPRKFFKRLKK